MRKLATSLKGKKLKTNKLVLGFVGIVATTIMGTAGLAAAQTSHATPAATGSGYGGTTTNNVTSNVNLSVSGSHNVVSIVINYIFGH